MNKGKVTITKMNNKYEIKLPASIYFQLIGSVLTTLVLFTLYRRIDGSPVFLPAALWLCILAQVIIIVIQLTRILHRYKELEISVNKIKINESEIPIQDIEKIIIDGYFIQSIGIKQFGKRFVSASCHFRFKSNEEVSIQELQQWATRNNIPVTSGKIIRWL